MTLPADPLTDLELKARIDTPDLLETLQADETGSLQADITAYLEAWTARIKSYQDAGLTQGEFDALTRLSGSVQTAGRVLEFFVKLKQLPPEQAHGN